MWHKAVLLISAAPITVLMNSVRIAVAGVIVNKYGIEWLEGFTHFFEGWVIFLICIVFLFLLARVLLIFQNEKKTLVEALDLDTEGLGTQFMRLRLVQPSAALFTSALVFVLAVGIWQILPQRGDEVAGRDDFSVFPAPAW